MPANTRELKARFDQARARRGNWESHWQEIADLVLPTRDFTVEREPGENAGTASSIPPRRLPTSHWRLRYTA